MAKKKKHPWTGQGIAEIVHEVWPDGENKLAAKMGISRNALWRLLRAKHQGEPVLMIESLHEVILARTRLDLGLTLIDLREAWGRTRARPKARSPKRSKDTPRSR